MHHNYGKLQAGRGLLPGTLGVLIGLILLVSTASAQEPAGYLSSSVKFTVDPQQLNLASLGGVESTHAVFQQPISFTVNLWTDNSITIGSEALTCVVDVSTGRTETMGHFNNLTASGALKIAVPGTETTDTTTRASGVSSTNSTLANSGWAIQHSIGFKLEGDKVSAVITSTVGSVTKKCEIPLGVVRVTTMFKPFDENPFLEGKDWLVGRDFEPLPSVITEFPPASSNPLLDYSAFGRRGFIDLNRAGTQPGWVVVGYMLYRGITNGRVTGYTIVAEYQSINTGGITTVIVRKEQFEQAYSP